MSQAPAQFHELADFKELLSDENAKFNQNVDSDLGIKRYIKNADQIKHFLPKGRILDWGCGLGHMSYLLKKRGFEVVSYELHQVGQEFLDRINQPLIVGTEPVALPFADGYFDAVLSSGVIEHVPQPLASLKEIGRILKSNGYFFIFRLPNKYSFIEYISDLLGRGDHPVKYTKKEIKQLLEELGYEILYLKYQGFLPYNLKGFPDIVRKFYHRFDGFLGKLDAFLSALPIINRLSTNIELVVRKKG